MNRQAGANASIPAEQIERAILLIRGETVLLDADLAKLYRVTTFNLNKAVKRNLQRFPQDFMFQLTQEEFDRLRFQSGISKPTGRGGRRYRPYAFTGQGVAMLSSVLHSERAIEVNIPSCGRSCACVKFCRRTKTSRASSMNWRESTTRTFESSSKPSVN